MSEDGDDSKMGFNATWSMAVGGMVGGGIFSVLGVVLSVAGQWAWLSFVVGGMIALAAASSYSALAEKFGEGGGAFTFLREVDLAEVAGSISWVIIIGYTLTISVYAFTFGHYLANVVELGAWLPRVAAVALILALVGVNLRGVSGAATLEIVTVWGKLVVLCGLGIWGITRWAPDQLHVASVDAGFGGALVGAASVFMAYEGFQLLAYDYDDVKDPERVVPLAMLTAIIAVIGVYVVVTLGCTMLVGGQTLIDQKEVALASAGKAVLGQPGVWIVTVAAVFSTASAINATLFAVGRLARRIATDGELPAALAHANDEGVPDRAVLTLGGVAALLAALGSLDMLVEAASLGFLITFSVVNALAFVETRRRRIVAALGFLGSISAVIVLIVRQAQHEPIALAVLVAIVLFATVGRHLILRRMG